MIKDIKLKDIMITNVAKISQDDKITTAGKIMAMKNIGSIVVIDNEDLAGILTEKDFLKKVIAKGLNPNDLYVRDIMTSNVITASREDSVFKAHEIMKNGKFRRLPIVDDNKMEGIVTETDVSAALSNFATMIKPQTENIKNIDEKHRKIATKDYNLDLDRSYLVVEEKPQKIFEVFLSLLKQGYAGLMITRVNPNEIRKEYGLKETMIVWLTNLECEEAIKPTELQKLLFTINGFINNAEKSVVLIDGVEYLANYTSFNEVLHLMQSLEDKTSVSENIMLVSLDPETFENKEFKLLERNLDVLKP